MEKATTQSETPAPFTFRIDIEIPAADIEAVLSTAFTHGIGHWGYPALPMGDTSNRRYLSEVLALDRRPLVIVEVEEDHHRITHHLGVSELGHGLQLYIAKRGWPSTDDLGNIDADEADALVQYAVFGKLIYG